MSVLLLVCSLEGSFEGGTGVGGVLVKQSVHPLPQLVGYQFLARVACTSACACMILVSVTIALQPSITKVHSDLQP